MVREFGLWPPPAGFRTAFVGEEVVFHEKEETRKDRSARGAKTDANSVAKRTWWTVTKMDGVEFLFRGETECATDVAVYKHITIDEVPIGEPVYCPLKIDDSRGGQERLRVWVDGEWLYLHQVLAFAFYRHWACPQVKDFQTFRKKFQGDHLAWVNAGELEVPTQPEWCFAGWIEAVARKEHDRRSGQLKRARAVLRRVAEFEEKERETAAQLGDIGKAFDALKRKNTARARGLQAKRRSLRCVQKDLEKKRSEGQKLLAKAWPRMDQHKDAIRKMKGLYFSFDGFREKSGALKAIGGNAFLASCFFETSEARQGLELYFHQRINAKKKVR